MGRSLKVTPLEVLDKIKESSRTTKDELADEFNVCSETIGSRLRDLRDNGEPILFDESGLFFLEGIENINDIQALEKYRDWVVKTLIGTFRCAKPVKPLTIGFKEKFKELTTREERVEFKKFFLKMDKLVEYLVLDDDED